MELFTDLLTNEFIGGLSFPEVAQLIGIAVGLLAVYAVWRASKRNSSARSATPVESREES